MNDSHSYLHFDEPDQLKLCLPGGKQAKFLVLGDAHCKFDDDRGIPYQEYTNRMKRCSPHFFPLVEERVITSFEAPWMPFSGVLMQYGRERI